MKPSPKMNINKRSNGGWILCPSKSIPGKFYYFNVLTGEAVWSLSETESKFVRKGNNIERVTDKMHNYPEPISPPKNTYTPNNYYPKNSFTNEPYQIQSFGHAIFPKYISNVQPNFSNIIWTPIQMPMFVTNTSEVRKETLDQNTQTSDTERDTLIETYSTPLSKRFALFGSTNMSLNADKNRDYNYVPAKPFQSSTPNKNWWSAGKFSSNTGISKNDIMSSDVHYKRKLDQPTLILKESKMKRLKTLSETDCHHKIDDLSSKMDTNNDKMGNTSLCQQNKIENVNTSAERNGSVRQLDKSDLRFLLQSKRRKSVDLGVLYNEKQKEEDNKIKGTPKKKVSFNLTNISDGDSSIDDAENDDEVIVKTPVSINHLKHLSKTSQMDTNAWFVSVDEDVLLDNYDFITDYVAEDNSCKLLIPDSVVKYIESLGMGEHGGRNSVIVARQVYRRLVTSEQVQIVKAKDGTSLMDDILECCLEMMNMNFHVVLITKYAKLEQIANSYGIHVYTLDDIKNGVLSTKMKTFQNNIKENLFLQNEDNFDPFILSKSVTPVKSFKKNIFNYNNDTEETENNNLNKEHITDYDKLFCTDRNDKTIINSDNSSIDVLNIEKLKINDEKLTNIKIVIKNSNIDNSKAKDKIIIDNSDKIKPFRSIFGHIDTENTNINNIKPNEKIIIHNSDRPKSFRSIFDHIDTENVQFVQNNSYIDNTKANEKINIDNSDKPKQFRSIFDHIDTENVQFNLNSSYIDNTKAKEKIIIDNSDKNKPFRSIFDHIDTENVQFNKNNSISKFSKIISGNDETLYENEVTEHDVNNKNTTKFNFESSRKLNYALTKDTTGKSNIWDANTINKEINIKNRQIYTIEDRLAKFYVKDEIVENNIIMRYEEWICCYVQIMENFIDIVLQKNGNTNYKVPYFLRDGLEYLKEIYFNTKDIKMIVEKLLTLGFCLMKGAIKKDIKPTEFMKILGCGFLLVEAFENILPEDLAETKDLLADLLDKIENSKTLEDPLPAETPIRRSEEDTRTLRPNFVKCRSEIIDYLKKHFVEWKNYDEFENEMAKNEEMNQNIKIFRTSGKDLKTFKIDNKKRITFEKPPKDQNLEAKNKEIATDKQTHKHTDVDISTLHGNTFNDNKDGPKVIRNVKPIDEFEEKVKISLDLDVLDYSEIVDTSSITDVSRNVNETQINETNDCPEFNDHIDLTRTNDSLSLINETLNDLRNDSTVDSGFGNEGPVSIVRTFLTDLSVSLKSTYTFIDKCVKDFREDEMTDESKRGLLDKANEIYIHIAEIIENLKSIIDRESTDGTLKSSLMKIGSDIAEDKRLIRYKQTVTKCLEQAQLLESSLRIMRNITNEDEISVSSKNEIRHFNIFE